jgi:putative transcriptional regulator
MEMLLRCAVALLVLAWGAGAHDASSAPNPHPAPDYRGGRVQRLAAGRLLVATPNLRGPFFQRSVVLLLEYSAETGALGVVVNRPTDVALAQVLPREPALTDRPHRAWLGGPVGRDRVTVLFRANGAPTLPEGGSHPVVDGIRVGVLPGVLRVLAEAGQGSDQWRAYVGYAGWMPGQLEREVVGGSWTIEEGEARWILAGDAEAVWSELMERAQGLQARIEAGPRERSRAPQRCATTYAIQAGSSGACSRRLKIPLPSSLFVSVPSQ